MLFVLLACTSGPGPAEGDDTSAPTDDTSATDDTGDSNDTGQVQGDVTLVLTAPATVRVDDAPVQVSVACVAYVDDALSELSPAITLAGAGSLEGDTLTLDAAGRAELTCTLDSHTATATVVGLHAASDSGWSHVAESYSQSLDALLALGASGSSDDAAFLQAIEDLRASVDTLDRHLTHNDPVVWNIPGGYPSAAEIAAGGFPATDDDAALAGVMEDVASALDAYVAAVDAYDLESDDEGQLDAIAQALDALETQVAAANALDISPSGGLAQRVAMQAHLEDHVLPAMTVGPRKIVAAVDAGAVPPFGLTSMLGLGSMLGIRGHLIEAYYGPAIDWIAGAVDTLATAKLIDAAWAPDPNGPEIWSVNFGGYAIFEGSAVTVNGSGFSDQADLNQILFVHQGIVTQAMGIFDDCKAAVDAATSEYGLGAVDKMDTCLDTLVDTLTAEPKTSMGTGPMGDGQDYLGVYGDQYFSIGVPPLTYSGEWVDLVIMIPVNLSNGLRGEQHGVLLYP
jgi:hypothetical protein